MVSAAIDEPLTDAELTDQAIAVLTANQLGDVTRPSPRLYPHQWSWDTAFIAIAYAHYDQDRAQRELRALFSAQWGNGMVPHIVFHDQGGPYFPGPDFWQVERSREAPSSSTSGIVQPPVHASAVLAILARAVDQAAARSFVEEMVPKLSAWHDYLYRERTRGNGLVEIWHPWESGMDNSPLWDDSLQRIRPGITEVPSYRRIDLTVAEASERPSDEDYDRYAYLVGLFRGQDYEPAAIRAVNPFVIHDALFNAILVQADRDLAKLARRIDEDPERYLRRAGRAAAALEQRLWDEEQGRYVDFDVRAEVPISTVTAAGFIPLYAAVPSGERARRMVEALRTESVRPGRRGFVLPSLAQSDARFSPNRYWRGPVWPVINWLVWRGLRRYGYMEEAEQIRTGLIDLARHGGFYEHYDPETGRGHGGEQFAWTAALILDLLLDDLSHQDQTDDREGGGS